MPHESGLNWRRFLVVVGTGGASAIGIAVFIFLGVVPIAISGTLPITVHTSGGLADSAQLALDTDQGATGSSSGGSARAAAAIRVTNARLNDLCLEPKFQLPLIGRLWAVRVSSNTRVALGDATLAAKGGKVWDVDLGPATLAADHGRNEKEGKSGAFALTSDESDDAVELGAAELEAYAVLVRGSLKLSTIGLGASVDTSTC